jgi:hypothetical protein
VRHVNDITSLSAVNKDRKIKNMSLRHALIPEPDEPGSFPNRILPSREENPRFYGRTEELDRITKYLSPKDDQSFRTYTIYGRRGVGKTEIALQFAHTNPCGFDALFWIQCETSVAIRQSFTKVAVSLNLPGADSDGHHEENLLKVHDWLKRTSEFSYLSLISKQILIRGSMQRSDGYSYLIMPVCSRSFTALSKVTDVQQSVIKFFAHTGPSEEVVPFSSPLENIIISPKTS